MKKNGFVFIESVTILVIVVLSLTLLLSNHYLLVRKSKKNEYYDLPKDKYLLYTIANLGEKNNPYGLNYSFIVHKNNCNTAMSTRLKTCKKVFENTNMKYYMIIYNLHDLITNNSDITNTYDSPTIEYLKTLRRCKDKLCNNTIGYVVGVFERNNKRYYASLELE